MQTYKITNTGCFNNESIVYYEIVSFVQKYTPFIKIKNVITPNQQTSALFHETMEFEQ